MGCGRVAIAVKAIIKATGTGTLGVIENRKKKVQRIYNEIELCSIRSIIGRLCDYCIAKGKGEEKGEAGKRPNKKTWGERSFV
jgi:hypothetical protein